MGKIRIIIAGTREFDNYDYAEESLDSFIEDNIFGDHKIEIVSGNAIGADRIGEKYAKSRKIPLKVIPALWFKEGRIAGVIRNKKMLDYAMQSDRPILYCFWNGSSKGTKNMIDISEKAGIEVYINRYDRSGKIL